MIIVLKSLGAKLNSVDINSCSIVRWASYKNELDLLKVCNLYKLPLGERDGLGMTPLHRSASSDARDTCIYLLFLS